MRRKTTSDGLILSTYKVSINYLMKLPCTKIILIRNTSGTKPQIKDSHCQSANDPTVFLHIMHTVVKQLFLKLLIIMKLLHKENS